jgi:mono/diheme cytochrome c family protein
MKLVRRIPTARTVAAIGAAGALLFITGCDPQENADTQHGRMLFQQKCGVCHALAEAGTAAQVGPNLDAAFAQARAAGEDQDTIEGVVSAQIENPRPASPDQVDIYMPPELVTGQDAADVASYVGSVAGIPGIKPPKLPPPELFAQQCGICHTLAAAGTTATTGPNLDQTLKGKDAAFIQQSIEDPNAVIASGFGPGIMPANFSQTLTQDDITGLVDYLLTSVNGGGK